MLLLVVLCCRCCLLSDYQAPYGDRIDSQPAVVPLHLSCQPFLLFWQEAVQHTADIFFYSLCQVSNLSPPPFSPPSSLSFHLCICIHLVLPHFVNTEPTHTSPPPPPCLISLLRVTSHSSMGLQLPSPSSCPLPCLCFEAVCCGSTNGRVRRKRCTSLGMHARQPWAEGARGVVDCLSLRSQ